MPSPFPGMDPYLEDASVWPGFHERLLTYVADDLQAQVLPQYYVELRERVYLESPRHVVIPDVTVERLRGPAHAGAAIGAVATADEPVLLLPPVLRQRELFLEIRALQGHEVITVIELVSPSNKWSSGTGRDEYLKKQREVLTSRANLVEMDLHRRGKPVVAASESQLNNLGHFDYLVCVNRPASGGVVEAYPSTVRDRLPRVRIPLREEEPDVVLDLPAVFGRCYDNGAYSVRLDYNEPARVPLPEPDDAWADALLRRAGNRDEAPN
jgi:hypothetical protein